MLEGYTFEPAGKSYSKTVGDHGRQDYATERINGKVCGSLPWEMGRYQYKREQKADEETLREKVRKVNDHLIDDLRYIAMVGAPGTGGKIKSALDGRW